MRARVVEVGRERLAQLRNRLAFIIVTEDISENSRDKALHEFACPVYQCMSSEEIEELFGFKGTKMVGFHRSPLANALLNELKPFLITVELLAKRPEALPVSPRIAVLGASGIGKHHCNWWNLEGAIPVAFLGSTPESIATTAENLKKMFKVDAKGYTSLENLLAEEKPDIVDVCLPPEMHFNAVHKALEAGCHVLCEKPFVYDDKLSREEMLAQADELQALAEEKRRMLGICTQYVMAVQECLAEYEEHFGNRNIETFEGTLIAPKRNRPMAAHWVWVDLAPHMLGVAQKLANNGRANWKSLKTDFDGTKAEASFDCERRGSTLLHCNILTMHRDSEPKNVRQIALNGCKFDIGGYNDENGIFNMRITNPWGTVDRPDMLRMLIRSFLNGKIEMPVAMARQNLDWMLTIMHK